MSNYLFSCENATYAVPADFAGLFSGHREVLACSEGWEPGALNLAQAMAMRFHTPLVHSETSRLLLNVEFSREQCWSRFSVDLDPSDQRRLIERYWQSYRSQLHRRIEADLARHGFVYHIMVHTDPDQQDLVELHTPKGATLSLELSEAWLAALKRDDLKCRCRTQSGESNLSRELAQQRDPDQYAQIRLSVHQDFFLMGAPWRWNTIKKHVLDALAISASRLKPRSQSRPSNFLER